MSLRRPILITAMIFTATAFSILGFFIFCPIQRVSSETGCPDGRFCPAHWLCCEQGCCAPATAPPRRDQDLKEPYRYPWYAQWPVLFLLGTLGGILVCCVWCLACRSQRVYMCSLACCVRRPASDLDSAGSVYPPPRYSRCGSFHQAPPPYSEVTSKPDLFPLVITCDEGDGKSGGNYLMVHYFRNYVIRAPGSISATSTAESLNSSFMCNAANEENSIIPPPYSSEFSPWGAGCGLLRSLSSLPAREPRPPPRSRTAPEPRTPRTCAAPEPRTCAAPEPCPPRTLRTPRTPPAGREDLTSPPQPQQEPSFDLELELLECELYCEGACRPRLGASPPALGAHGPHGAHGAHGARDAAYEREARGLRRLFTRPAEPAACESPPQPTSPTQSRDSTLRRIDVRRKTSLYMPLTASCSRTKPGVLSSRSAPATPCAALVPGLLHFTRHGSRSSRCDEEDPLLDGETSRDHKF